MSTSSSRRSAVTDRRSRRRSAPSSTPPNEGDIRPSVDLAGDPARRLSLCAVCCEPCADQPGGLGRCRLGYHMVRSRCVGRERKRCVAAHLARRCAARLFAGTVNVPEGGAARFRCPVAAGAAATHEWGVAAVSARTLQRARARPERIAHRFVHRHRARRNVCRGSVPDHRFEVSIRCS